MGRDIHSLKVNKKMSKSEAFDHIRAEVNGSDDFEASFFKFKSYFDRVFDNYEQAQEYGFSKLRDNEGAAVHFYAPSEEAVQAFDKMKSAIKYKEKINKLFEECCNYIESDPHSKKNDEADKVRYIACESCGSKVNTKYIKKFNINKYGLAELLRGTKETHAERNQKVIESGSLSQYCPVCNGTIEVKMPIFFKKFLEEVKEYHDVREEFLSKKKEIHTFIGLISKHY